MKSQPIHQHKHTSALSSVLRYLHKTKLWHILVEFLIWHLKIESSRTSSLWRCIAEIWQLNL